MEKCRKCSEELAFKTSAFTRVEFAMKHSELVDLTCKSCGKKNKFHVDELYTRPSKLAQLVAGLSFLFGTFFVLILISPIFKLNVNHYVVYMAGCLLLIPVFIYIIINKQEQNRVSNFNKIKLKGRIHNI